MKEGGAPIAVKGRLVDIQPAKAPRAVGGEVKRTVARGVGEEFVGCATHSRDRYGSTEGIAIEVDVVELLVLAGFVGRFADEEEASARGTDCGVRCEACAIGEEPKGAAGLPAATFVGCGDPDLRRVVLPLALGNVGIVEPSSVGA